MSSTILSFSTALALAGLAFGSPLREVARSEAEFTSSPLYRRVDVSDTKPLDVAQCYWTSYTGAVGWAITMPQFDGKSVADMQGDMIGSLHQNAACAGVTKMIGHAEWYAVGKENTTAAFLFDTSDFCTAWQMTKVIKDATGNKQDTPCFQLTEKSSDDKPDPGNLAYDSFGNDGSDEGSFEKRAAPQHPSSTLATATKSGKKQPQKTNKPSAASGATNTTAPSASKLINGPQSQPSKPSDADMAKLLGLAVDASHDAIIKILQGPSKLDHHNGTAGANGTASSAMHHSTAGHASTKTHASRKSRTHPATANLPTATGNN